MGAFTWAHLTQQLYLAIPACLRAAAACATLQVQVHGHGHRCAAHGVAAEIHVSHGVLLPGRRGSAAPLQPAGKALPRKRHHHRNLLRDAAPEAQPGPGGLHCQAGPASCGWQGKFGMLLAKNSKETDSIQGSVDRPLMHLPGALAVQNLLHRMPGGALHAWCHGQTSMAGHTTCPCTSPVSCTCTCTSSSPVPAPHLYLYLPPADPRRLTWTASPLTHTWNRRTRA